MKIDAIITCVGEKSANFLELTVLPNKRHFANSWIITDSKDALTQRLVNDYGLKCFVTDLLYKNGARFNRGAAFNELFPQIENDWVCLMDVDIFIPSEARLSIQELDPEFFYGARRIIVPTLNQFLKGANDDLQCPQGLGYGYFQLFNRQSKVIKEGGFNYPEMNDVLDGDWMFRNRWGDMNADYTEAHGLLKELPFKIWHLGDPGNISFGNGKGFFDL